MRIEEAAPLPAADRSALAALWVAAWNAAMPSIDFEARRPWIEARLQPMPGSDERLLVARPEDGAPPQGFALLDPARAYLDQIVVARAAQGTGVGTLLLDRCKALCPAGLALYVNRDNPGAVAFYARNGFERTGEGVNPASGLPVLAMAWRPEAR